MIELLSKSKQANRMFRELYGQVECGMNDLQKKPKRGFEHLDINKRGTLNQANNLYNKYKAKSIDKYNSRDILYYYKDLAKECGIKFVSNISLDNRYMRNIKQALQNYTIEEVLGMYEFLFKSPQTYLDMKSSHPGIILTQWGNRIYNDSLAFKEGNYKEKNKFTNREYSGDTTESAVGEWDLD